MRHNTLRRSTLRRYTSGLALILAASLAVPACSKKDSPETAQAVTKEVTASGALEQLAAPAGVLAFGGADSPEQLIQHVARLLGPAGQQLTSEVAMGGLERSLGLGAGTIDATKPARFLVADPKLYAEPLAVAFVVKNRDAFIAALPPSKTMNEGGDAYSWTEGTKAVFVNLLDDHAVVTHAPQLFAKQREFFTKLLGSKIEGAFSSVLSVKNIAAAFNAELDAFAAEMEANIGRIKAPGASLGAPEQSLELVRAAARFARELDTVTMSAAVPGGDLMLTVDTRAKAGTELAKHFTGSKPGALALMAKIPADAKFAAVFSIDPAGDNALMKQLSQWGMKLGVGAGSSAELTQATEAFYRATTGEMALFAYRPEGTSELAIVSLTGVKDAPRMRAAWAEFMKMYSTDSMKKALVETGLELKFTAGAYKVGDVPVNVTEAKLNGDAKKRPELAQLGSLFESLTTSHSAVTDEFVIVAMGATAKASMEAWLGGTVKGGLDLVPGLVKARGRAAENAVALVYGSPAELMQLVMGAPTPPQAQAQPGGIALSIGQKEGALRVVLDLPAAEVQTLSAVFGALAGSLR
ncbi:MAG: hypothetical protein EXR75_00670 [Myxococcales bacterium]|nr:hypothetical protein [Myxococcales bacterium]